MPKLTKTRLAMFEKMATEQGATLKVEGDSIWIIPPDLTPPNPIQHRAPNPNARTKTFEIRLSPGELDQLRCNADGAGMTVSEFIRQHTIGGGDDD